MGYVFSFEQRIRVERSNGEEKIDQLSKDIQKLQKQMTRLVDAVGKNVGSDEAAD